MNSVSLKRKLQKLDKHSQEQLKLARKHVALYLYQVEGCSNQEVTHYPLFNDINNFPRSFKDWTGCTPGPSETGVLLKPLPKLLVTPSAPLVSRPLLCQHHWLIGITDIPCR